MKYIIEKLIALFCIIVFVTFLLNHGHMDFSGVEWVKNKTISFVKSDEGQEIIQETKDISIDVFKQFFSGIKELVSSNETNSEDNKLTSAKYITTVDGDTIKVEIDGDEKTIRLIGIDAPESVNPDTSLNTEYGELSSEYLKTLMENTTNIYLEYDVSTEDTYGRTLAYVWISPTADSPETNMLNAILVKNGYAKDTVYLPNNKYSDIFMNLRIQACENKTGLWKHNEYVQLASN